MVCIGRCYSITYQFSNGLGTFKNRLLPRLLIVKSVLILEQLATHNMSTCKFVICLPFICLPVIFFFLYIFFSYFVVLSVCDKTRFKYVSRLRCKI